METIYILILYKSILHFYVCSLSDYDNEVPSYEKGGLRFASYYSDHMVLQRDRNVTIWGYAGISEASKTITVKLLTQSGSVKQQVSATVRKGKQL